jgi:hypothetical protein
MLVSTSGASGMVAAVLRASSRNRAARSGWLRKACDTLHWAATSTVLLP